MMLRLTPVLAKLGFATAVVVSAHAVALAQSAGGSGGATGGTSNGSGQVHGEGDQTNPSNGTTTSSKAGVAGTGMGGTTPAMQNDTSSTSGNGQSVQRPDPNAGQTGGAGSSNSQQ